MGLANKNAEISSPEDEALPVTDAPESPKEPQEVMRDDTVAT